jgi:integrase/recombinase XerD
MIHMNAIIPYSQQRSDLMLRKPLDSITITEAEAIRRACDIIYEQSKHSENDAWIRDRDKLLLSMMWVTGARISDVLSMREDNNNINFGDKSITFLVKKRKLRDKKTNYVGEFWHRITLDMETVSEIANYIHIWKIHGYLFPSHRNSGKPLTRQAVALKLNKLAETIGFNRPIHAHLWRHGLATYLLSKGASAEYIAFRLAHSSTAVTLENYARYDHNNEREMLDNLGIKLRND